jgi:hypothetical protein
VSEGGEAPRRREDIPVGECCAIAGCVEPVAEGDVVYCAGHRERADDGSLWLRCVFDGGHASVAPNDLIACAEHRRKLDALRLACFSSLREVPA